MKSRFPAYTNHLWAELQMVLTLFFSGRALLANAFFNLSRHLGFWSLDFRSFHAEGFLQAINPFAQRFDEPVLLPGGMEPDVNILRLDAKLCCQVLDGNSCLTSFFQTG